MKKVLFVFLLSSFTLTAHPPTVIKIKKEMEQKKNHPDLVFSGKLLMIIGAIGTVFFSLIRFASQLGDAETAQERKELYDFYHRRTAASYGTFLAGTVAYYIGKVCYNNQDSSLKNLFSRAALAQKIFNI